MSEYKVIKVRWYIPDELKSSLHPDYRHLESRIWLMTGKPYIIIYDVREGIIDIGVNKESSENVLNYIDKYLRESRLITVFTRIIVEEKNVGGKFSYDKSPF